ncbi:MAG TPA: class I SAM-dependent methyltransferase [Casimicrobiaceae bacterium]|nr:class I SAM-dependent methyltransferase [Casimicrobiaceae bacterium]
MMHADISSRAVLPDEIAFDAPGAPRAHDLSCPACGARGPAARVLSVPSIGPPHPTLELFRCEACGTLVFDPPAVTDFADVDQVGGDAWRHYVEAGGDVWEALWPALIARERGSLLDVGCGFGFGVDFWRGSGRGEAIGVESAIYGRLGREMLGAPIVSERLDTSAHLAGRRFDVVLASEVIEHTSDPRAFVAVLAGHVADDGVLVLTTPDASCIDPSTEPATTLAALSPGFHGFVLSRQAFDAAVEAAGFAHRHWRSFNGRQFLWASRRAFALPDNRDAYRAPVLDYLARRGQEDALEPSVRIGYLFRLCRDLTRARRFAEAGSVLHHLDALIAERHGTEALDPARAIERLRACRTPQEAGGVGSYCLPMRFLFAAQIAQNLRGDYAGALASYRAAAEATEICAALGPVWFMEAIATLWTMRIDGALLGLALGSESAADELALAVDEGWKPMREHAFATVAPGYLDRLLPAVAEDLLQRGGWSAARKVADMTRRHVERAYARRLVEVAEIEAALADPAAALPPWPLFVPWFDALLQLGPGGDPSRGQALAGEVLRVAEAHARDPRCGDELRALAQRVRERFGAVDPAR